METQSNVPALLPREHQSLAERLSVDAGSYSSSWAQAPDEVRLPIIAACEGESDLDGLSVVNTTQKVVGYYCRWTEFTREDGEFVRVLRVALVTVDGKVIVFASEGAERELLNKIMRPYGHGPWPQGLPVTFSKINAKRGSAWCWTVGEKKPLNLAWTPNGQAGHEVPY